MPMTHRGETTPTQLHFENQNIAEPWPLMVFGFCFGFGGARCVALIVLLRGVFLT